MKLNISMMRDTAKCPQYAHNIHIARRGPSMRPAVLDVGTLFHEAMELRLKDQLIADYLQQLPSWWEVSQDARDAWVRHQLWLPINAFQRPPEWEVVGVEKVLERQAWSGAWTLQGRLDAVIRWNGKYWSLQWKTYDNDLLQLQEKVRLSWHEVGYQWLAETDYYPWGGTILGACQKLPGYRIVDRKKTPITDEERSNALTFHLLFRSPAKQIEMVEELFKSLDDTHHKLGQSSPVRRNYDFCFGTTGRTRCPFFDVCHHGASLDGPQFVTLEPRY